MSMKCDIILPVCDQYDFTKKCIESIVEHTDTPFRLIIINNGSNPDTRKLLNELDNNSEVETTIIHNDHNIGWVKALNKGMYPMPRISVFKMMIRLLRADGSEK